MVGMSVVISVNVVEGTSVVISVVVSGVSVGAGVVVGV